MDDPLLWDGHNDVARQGFPICQRLFRHRTQRGSQPSSAACQAAWIVQRGLVQNLTHGHQLAAIGADKRGVQCPACSFAVAQRELCYQSVLSKQAYVAMCCFSSGFFFFWLVLELIVPGQYNSGCFWNTAEIFRCENELSHL